MIPAYLTLGGIFLTFGDILMKKWAIETKYMYYGFSMILYIVGLIFFSLTLKEKNLAIASTILVTVNTISITLVSIFYFHEKLSITQGIGLLFGIVCVILLEIGG